MTFLIPTYRIGGLERDQRSVRDAAPESGGEAANQEDDEHGRAGEKQEPDDLLQEGATWPAVRERARARRVPEDKDAHGSPPHSDCDPDDDRDAAAMPPRDKSGQCQGHDENPLNLQILRTVEATLSRPDTPTEVGGRSPSHAAGVPWRFVCGS